MIKYLKLFSLLASLGLVITLAACSVSRSTDAPTTASATEETTTEEVTTTEEDESTHVHEWVGTVTKEATCTEKGTKTYTCSGCNRTYTEAIPALGHDWADAEAVAATCTEPGLTAGHKCTRCGATEGIEEVPALGHTWNDGEVTTEATCTEEGEMLYTCTVCGETKKEAIPAKGHDTVLYPYVAPTCTEIGHEEYVKCLNCDYTTYEEIPALGHNYEWVIDVATSYDGPGVEHEQCTRCNAINPENTNVEIPQLFHVMTLVEKVLPDCENTGKNEYYSCSECNKYFEDEAGKKEITDLESWGIIPAKGHDYKTVAKVDALWNKDGNIEYYTCSRCDKLFVLNADGETYSVIQLADTVIPMTGLNYGTSEAPLTADEARKEILQMTTTDTNNNTAYVKGYVVKGAPSGTNYNLYIASSMDAEDTLYLYKAEYTGTIYVGAYVEVSGNYANNASAGAELKNVTVNVLTNPEITPAYGTSEAPLSYADAAKNAVYFITPSTEVAYVSGVVLKCEASKLYIYDGTNVNSSIVVYDKAITADLYPTNAPVTVSGNYQNYFGTLELTTPTVTIASYTVTFDTQGGSAVDPVKVYSHTKGSALAAIEVTKEGSALEGWYIGETKITDDMEITSDITVTAKWEVATFTVTYDADGGDAVTSVTKEYGTALSVFTAATTKKNGYNFVKWQIVGSDGTLSDVAADATLKADITLKAIWELGNVTVTFLNADGTTISSNEVAYNSDVTEPTMTDILYTDSKYYLFNGWDSAVSAKATATVTYKAVYLEAKNVSDVTAVNTETFAVAGIVVGVDYGYGAVELLLKDINNNTIIGVKKNKVDLGLGTSTAYTLGAFKMGDLVVMPVTADQGYASTSSTYASYLDKLKICLWSADNYQGYATTTLNKLVYSSGNSTALDYTDTNITSVTSAAEFKAFLAAKGSSYGICKITGTINIGSASKAKIAAANYYTFFSGTNAKAADIKTANGYYTYIRNLATQLSTGSYLSTLFGVADWGTTATGGPILTSPATLTGTFYLVCIGGTNTSVYLHLINASDIIVSAA